MSGAEVDQLFQQLNEKGHTGDHSILDLINMVDKDPKCLLSWDGPEMFSQFRERMKRKYYKQ